MYIDLYTEGRPVCETTGDKAIFYSMCQIVTVQNVGKWLLLEVNKVCLNLLASRLLLCSQIYFCKASKHVYLEFWKIPFHFCMVLSALGIRCIKDLGDAVAQTLIFLKNSWKRWDNAHFFKTHYLGGNTTGLYKWRLTPALYITGYRRWGISSINFLCASLKKHKWRRTQRYLFRQLSVDGQPAEHSPVECSSGLFIEKSRIYEKIIFDRHKMELLAFEKLPACWFWINCVFRFDFPMPVFIHSKPSLY